MSSSSNSSNKRIRSDTNIMHLKLSDLPEGLLPKVASYLPNTSCVSFAISLFDAPTSQEPSIMSKTIATASEEGWDIVDFKDIQGIFGRNLTDEDIRWILLATDGVDKIKSLKFTNCIGITGSGLQPLMGSTVLERIDLCLVGDHENPTLNPEPPISAELVVPILNSIIGREDNVLVHVQLPKKWRVERSDILTQFLQRFDRQLNNRRYPCSKPECDGSCEDLFEDDTDYQLVCWQEHRHKGYEQYGTVAMSCYLCKKNFCGGCDWDGDGARFAMCCDKFYCDECNAVYSCQGDCTTVHQATTCNVCDVFTWW
jgi:hypothetical protein